MSFWRIFLGDWGQDLDISAAEKEIEELQEASHSKEVTDRKQNTQIGQLQQRVFELEQGLSVLMKQLHAKNVLGPAELEQFARFMADAERQAMASKSQFDPQEKREAKYLDEEE